VHTARRAAAEAGVRLPGARAVVGAAGAGRRAEQSELGRALSAGGLAADIRVLPDGEVGLIAAFREEPGVVIVAGTGSVAFARDLQGTVHRAGGYGWQMGDEAGGYWLGRRALELAARAHDGRAQGTTLLARLLAELDLRGFDDLIRWATTATPAQVAGLAPHVVNAASEGEQVAQQVVADAAKELAGLATALALHFPGTDPIPVAAMGGVLAPDSALRAALRSALATALPRAQLVTSTRDPAVAALELAAG
jgi:glucosamine kinase